MTKNKKNQEYIFGYGSLINDASRKKSSSFSVAYPVKVKGVKRGWNFKIDLPNENATALGASYQKNSICNGVLIEVNKKQIKDFDGREKSVGYKRIQINNRDIKSLSSFELPNNAIVWVYVGKNPKKATKSNPLLQSYIDVIMTGALKISEQFAKDFVRTTRGWSVNWVNDRKKPIYIRAMKKVPMSKKIDSILKNNLIKFNKRKKYENR